jgi:NTE family protein
MSFSFYNLEHHSEIISILPTFEHPISITDSKEIPYIIERGERATEEQLPYLRRLLAKNENA